MQKNLKNIGFREWTTLFERLGLKKYAVFQVMQWLFQRGATSFDEMTNLSKEARRILSERFFISQLRLADTLEDPDGTVKFLFGLEDGLKIESVLIPAEDGRKTLCISSQVGCALACLFCRTGRMGFKRNLSVSEIVDQVLEVKRRLFDITNIVFMGMGEPLMNYDNVKGAIEVLKDEKGVGLAKRRITLSTAGIVPKILDMAADKLGVKLAVSLSATTDDLRRRLMPVAKHYSIDDIIAACREYNPPGGRHRTTFEYVLIDGINDSADDMRRLALLMSRLPSKVNLIPYNPCPGVPFKKPKEKVLKTFYNYLYNKHIQVNIRQSRGSQIMAACGQLAGE